MKLLIISDLHLSDNDCYSVFGWSQEEFIEKLETTCILYGIDKIILNGDIFELCRYKLKDIIQTNKKILNYLSSAGAIFIRGNHDYKVHWWLDHYDIINSKGYKIHIEHGHKADFFGNNKIGRFLSNTFLKIVKRLINLSPVYTMFFRALEREEELLHPQWYCGYSYLRFAHRLHRRHDIVVLGHTHKTEAHKSYQKDRLKLYLNSGTCTFNRFQGIVLDTESLLYDVIRLNGSISLEVPKNNPFYFSSAKKELYL
jgi:predicted phosphodiesterase